MTQAVPVKVMYPPAVLRLNGKCWAVSGSTWIRVPLDTTRDDLDKYMVWSRPEIRTDNVKTWQVEGSKGNMYKVTLTGNRWSCTCPGFKWRNSCKHISAKKEAK